MLQIPEIKRRNCVLMSNDTPPSSVHAVRSGTISLEDRLRSIEELVTGIKETLDQDIGAVREELGTGARHFALLNLRVRALEIVVYGGCGVVLIAVLSSLIILVLRDPPTASASPTTIKVGP